MKTSNKILLFTGLFIGLFIVGTGVYCHFTMPAITPQQALDSMAYSMVKTTDEGVQIKKFS